MKYYENYYEDRVDRNVLRLFEDWKEWIKLIEWWGRIYIIWKLRLCFINTDRSVLGKRNECRSYKSLCKKQEWMERNYEGACDDYYLLY